ncbi:hypothetical protein [Pseudomonas sp. OHS18]|uniref:hypothetical protein n=1 Tax=Pseudomonas sp. OHS18 TaxID=3399679 RepID=UPI003A899736
MNEVLETFDLLCARAEAAYNEELDRSYECHLLDILNFIKENLAFREAFVRKFEAILVASESPFECVAFCMRELKWPEIKEYAEQHFNPATDPRTEALRTVLTAYDDIWPDSDLYEYYSR